MKVKTDQPIFKNRLKITRTIADFWNKTSEGWRTIWGPHIHHGFYENNEAITPVEAQEILIKKLAEKLDITPETKILDVGCGMGGSSLFLAKHYQAIVNGITLSHTQVEIARQQSKINNINNVFFDIEDALSLDSIKDESFDVIWSLESCEQFYDKNLFIQQAFRVLKPNGKLMLATWCSDRDEYEEKYAQKYRKLCHAFDLPYMPTMSYYQKELENKQFKINEVLDWTRFVEKSWDVGISQLKTYSLAQLLKMVGWRGFNALKKVRMMRDAFHEQRIKYGVFFATK